MILRNITWIYSLTWIRVTWKFTYSTFSKANMKNCNYNHHSKQSSPNTNWMKLFGELLNLTIKNNCYWTKIYCASSFFFFKYCLKYSNPQFVKGLVGINWPLNLHKLNKVQKCLILRSQFWSQNKAKYRSNLWNHKKHKYVLSYHFEGGLLKGSFL